MHASLRSLRPGWPFSGRVLATAAAALLLLSVSAPRVWAAQPLHVFIWSEYLDPEVVKDFERQQDAKVILDYYEDSEAMLSKLQAAGGQYDIVVPPDHVVPVLVKLRLLQPLRRERLPNFRNLSPRFIGLPFDPRNEHTVAYQWGTVGLYFRRLPGRTDPDSWGAILDPARQHGAFVLIDSMRDALGAALKYRGHGLNSTDVEELKEARDLLVSAKKRSTAFEGSVGGKNRVLARTADLAIVYSGEAARGIAEDKATAYIVPKEGSQIWVDSLAIPSGAPHRDLAEAFINFLLDPKVAARVSEFTQFATPNEAAKAHLKPADLANPTIYPPAEVMKRLEFLQDAGPKTRLLDQIWTQVKVR